MAVARIHTWISGEVLTASDLNTEFNNLVNAGVAAISPLTAALDFASFQATNFRFQNQTATQSVGAAGFAYWHTGENSLHISTGSTQARVPALTAIQAGELVGIVNPSGVEGATIFSRIQLSTLLLLSGTTLTVGTITPAKGGTGIDTSATATGALLTTGGTGSWTTLGPGIASQFLMTRGAGDVPTWAPVPTPKWVKFGATGNILSSSGVASVARESTGEYRVTWTTPFSSTAYVVIATGGGNTEQYVKTSAGTAYATTHVWLSARNQNGTVDDVVNGVISVMATE